jgi:hypothetical protein
VKPEKAPVRTDPWSQARYAAIFVCRLYEPPDSSLCAQGILLTNKNFKRLNL